MGVCRLQCIISVALKSELLLQSWALDLLTTLTGGSGLLYPCCLTTLSGGKSSGLSSNVLYYTTTTLHKYSGTYLNSGHSHIRILGCEFHTRA